LIFIKLSAVERRIRPVVSIARMHSSPAMIKERRIGPARWLKPVNCLKLNGVDLQPYFTNVLLKEPLVTPSLT